MFKQTLIFTIIFTSLGFSSMASASGFDHSYEQFMECKTDKKGRIVNFLAKDVYNKKTTQPGLIIIGYHKDMGITQLYGVSTAYTGTIDVKDASVSFTSSSKIEGHGFQEVSGLISDDDDAMGAGYLQLIEVDSSSKQSVSDLKLFECE